jgi:uncharacterized phage-like protein YoqJ
MIVAFTGHRPEDCVSEGHARIVTNVKLRYKPQIDTVITGMAAGYDLWAADEALTLGLKIWCAIPWKGHTPRNGDEELYAKIKDAAEKVVYISEAQDFPGNKVYHDRNYWMVDHADVVMAYWNPEKTNGGTFNCVQYAADKKPVANVYLDPPF